LSNSLASTLLNPPLRLRPLSDRWTSLVGIFWIAVFVSAAAVVVIGTMHALRDTYKVRPAFVALGLDYDVETGRQITVQIMSAGAGKPPDGPLRIAAINGKPVAADVRAPDLARRLNAAGGPTVELDLRTSEGELVKLQQKREAPAATASARSTRDFRIAARLTSGLLACGALLLCSLFLARRRPNDPVALLLAFAFAGMAATIDPAMAMWIAMGWPPAYDIISSAWFYLLLIGLAVFPDGIFVPKSYRWLVLGGIPLAVFVSLPNIDPNLSVFVGVGSLLAILIGQAVRYRRLRVGIERQQIKWAVFGFAVGLLLVLAAFVVLLFVPEDPSAQNPWVSLAAILLFSIGMATIPLGLLIALTRFRLWEADTIISRSAAYAVVTMLVGIVWAASADLAKLIISTIMGQQHEAGATAIGAIVAVGVFGPTQNAVLGWTRQRFASPADRLGELPDQLKEWSMTDTPNELGGKILEAIGAALHTSSAALYCNADGEFEELARQTAEPKTGAGPTQTLQLESESGPAGKLVLGPRTDGNRYSRKELEALHRLSKPIANALRVSGSRHGREVRMQQMIDQMQARLAQLDGGSKPSPA
jgi:hypothetical protein